MSEDKTDIEIWGEEYPFLEDVWNTYKNFDKDVDMDDNRRNYNSLCSFILNKENGELIMYHDFCMKLMRNLGYYTLDRNLLKFTQESCNILHNWIYNSIIKKKATDDVVNKCFNKCYSYMDTCYFESYDEIYKEPLKITLLDIFIYKTPDIMKTLSDEDGKVKFSAQKFVCECLKIYNNMNETYCSNGKEKKNDHKRTCSKLSLFKDAYNGIRNFIISLNSYIPSLDNIDKNLIATCTEKENILQLFSDARETSVSSSGNSLHTTTETDSKILEERRNITHGNIDSPMQKTITSTIGTFAGTSLLLALLYKFTPLGLWINTKILGKDKLLDNMKKNEQEFLLNSSHTRDINSCDTIYRIKYNAGVKV